MVGPRPRVLIKLPLRPACCLTVAPVLFCSPFVSGMNGSLNITYLDEFHILPPAFHRCADPVHIRFVVDKVVLGQVPFQVLLFSPASIIPPGIHICHLLLLSEGQAGETWKILNKQCCREDWEHANEKSGLKF